MLDFKDIAKEYLQGRINTLIKNEKISVTKQSAKTKSFNTNNQKCKKKQVQTNKRTLIF